MRRQLEMSLNPREYDLGELRGAELDYEYPEGDPFARGADDVLRSGHYRELLLLESGARDLEKPYLTSMPRTIEAERIAFEWLEFMVEKGGYKRTCDAVRHYRSLGWLTEAVEAGLRDYLGGVPETEGETRPFDQSDHLLSLIYIGQLATA